MNASFPLYIKKIIIKCMKWSTACNCIVSFLPLPSSSFLLLLSLCCRWCTQVFSLLKCGRWRLLMTWHRFALQECVVMSFFRSESLSKAWSLKVETNVPKKRTKNVFFYDWLARILCNSLCIGIYINILHGSTL